MFSFLPHGHRPGLVVPLALAAILVALSLVLGGPVDAAKKPAKKAAAQKVEKAEEDEDKERGKTTEHSGKEKQGTQVVLDVLKGRPAAVRSLTVRGQTIADAPPFEVSPRLDKMEFFPCDDCHEPSESNPKVRELTEEHPNIVFRHGGGRYWCYDVCHNQQKMNNLVGFRGVPISYNESYLLCGQCHFERQKDWFFGGHGKRRGAWEQAAKIPLTRSELLVKDRETIGTWQGKRKILICVECHDPHSPAIKPFKPSPPPALRSGIDKQPIRPPKHKKGWENGSQEYGGGK